MTNNALIYRRPSKWPIAAAVTAAVIIHLSAVAIAFHQEPSPTQPAAIDSKTIGVDLADDPPTPAPDLERVAAVGNPKAFVLNAPRPDYPYEARSRHITGSGIAVITVDPNSGLAVDAMMEQSIGNPILDNSTVSAFRRWRFKPGTPRRVRIPINFVLTGAQY